MLYHMWPNAVNSFWVFIVVTLIIRNQMGVMGVGLAM